MNILALDIASKTGWAQQENAAAKPEFGVEELPKPVAEFADAFDKWLNGRIENNRPKLIAVESPVPVRGTTTLDIQLRAYGAHAITRMLCLRSEIEFFSVGVGTWRKSFVGRPRAPQVIDGIKLTPGQRRRWIKKATVARCAECGWDVLSDDAADALGVLAYARQEYGGGDGHRQNAGRNH